MYSLLFTKFHWLCVYVCVFVASLNSENQSRNELHMIPPDGEGERVSPTTLHYYPGRSLI